MENTSDSLMPRPLLLCLKSEKIVCYSVPDNTKATGIKAEYHTQRWKDMRAYIMSLYNGIDIYMMYKHGRMIPADTVHHIERTADRPDLFYCDTNLIPVSDAAHREIHRRYKTEDTVAVQKELNDYMRRYKDTGGGSKSF